MGLIVEYGVVTAYEAEEGVFSVTVPEEAEEIEETVEEAVADTAEETVEE